MGENSQSSKADKPMSGNRLAKVMARHGLCSRRQAEQWIKDGRVRVNQETIRTPAFNVSDDDKIEVDGTAISEKKGTRVWLYHKPAGLVVTESDPEGRPTVFEEFARRGLPRVMTVGRLDINTEGLLMLTNDGGLKRTLELPATGWLRRYRVRAHGRVTQAQLDRLKTGLTVEGVRYGSIDAKLEREQGANVWLIVALAEGKNREVKNVLASIGLQVNRLIRTSFGPFQLGDIPVGGIDTVKARVLQDQLGQKLAKKAGVDFAAPMPDSLPAQPSSPSKRQRGRLNRDERSQSEPRPEKPEAPKGNPNRMGFKGRDDQTRRGAPRGPDEEDLRKVHFSDGRDAEMFEPQAKSKQPGFDKGGKGGGKGEGKFGGKPGGKPGGKFSGKPRGKPFGGKPDFKKSDRPDRGDRPDRPSRPARPKPTRK